MSSEHSALLKEVFIDPIRSVLIVDDDYPTYEDILAEKIAGESGSAGLTPKNWRNDPSRVMDVIKSFRHLPIPPVLDIHDGSNIGEGDERKLAKHLHQSDLLVLDYQLDGPGGDGTKSIEIIKTLMRSNHFNLVVVHTNADLRATFDEVLLALLGPSDERPTKEKLESAADMIFEAEAAHEGISERLKASIQISQYLPARTELRSAVKSMLVGAEPYKLFKDICDSVDGWKAPDIMNAFKWCLCSFEDSIIKKLALPGAEPVNWSDSEPYWIRSGTAFVTFTNKSQDATIVDALLDALIAWKPQPSRLFLAKLRAEIDDLGVVAENVVMGGNFVLARWYEQLLKGTKETRKTLIGDTVDRHTEQLIANVRHRVEVFAEKVVEIDVARSEADVNVIQDYFNIDLGQPEKRRQAERDHNIFVSSKPPTGWHLNTGHVFEYDDCTWVCLSPACDLVPRDRAGYSADIGADVTSFVGVKLHDCGNGLKDFGDIQLNRYIYLKIGDAEKAFSFNKTSDANPIWSAMYAFNQGKLDADQTFEVSRVRKVGNDLIANKGKAKIVGQLRYEYALNLVQKFGGSFTRVGLDYSGD